MSRHVRHEFSVVSSELPSLHFVEGLLEARDHAEFRPFRACDVEVVCLKLNKVLQVVQYCSLHSSASSPTGEVEQKTARSVRLRKAVRRCREDRGGAHGVLRSPSPSGAVPGDLVVVVPMAATVFTDSRSITGASVSLQA